MSWNPAEDAHCRPCPGASPVELVIAARRRDVASLPVRRLLPVAQRRLVGPFLFFDHMGPVELGPGDGVDVPPHPHIGLATVTYLFAGELFHRDSLGTALAIAPGAINWMVAGRGVVHSERTAPAERARASELHGIQLWVALPREAEEQEPSFSHHPADSLPERRAEGATLRLLLGQAFGLSSPVPLASPLFYAELRLEPGACFALPPELGERAAYLVEGALSAGPERLEAGQMAVFQSGSEVSLRAEEPSLVMLLGGPAFPEPRAIDWNFVSTSRERIAAARAAWREDRFPRVPGDELERVPYPGDWPE